MDTEKAREMQAKGVETRRRNKELREAMKLSAAEFRKIRDDIITEMPTAVEILKVQLIKAMQVGDQETIERLAIALAEYEQPKLQRIDQTTKNIDTTSMSEEELDRKIKELSDVGQ